jgi:hypothetical protein
MNGTPHPLGSEAAPKSLATHHAHFRSVKEMEKSGMTNGAFVMSHQTAPNKRGIH